MSEHVTRLRKAAEEIRREGHAGWGNTCEEAADEIERLLKIEEAVKGSAGLKCPEPSCGMQGSDGGRQI